MFTLIVHLTRLKGAYKMKQKKKPLQIYLTDEQKAKLKQLAAKEGLTMSGYIVDTIRRKK